MIFFTGFSQICNLLIIGIICRNIPQIEGWTLWEILLLYSFLLFSEGCINFFFQGIWKITEIINFAELDIFLVRPVPIGLQIITARIDFDGLNKMIIAIIVFLIGITHCDFNWSIVKAIELLFIIINICIIRICMIWIASCASFWLKGENNSLNFMILSIGEMAKYPLEIYPFLLRGIFAYLIPYAFVSYYPVEFLLGKNKSIMGILLVPVISIIMVVLSVKTLKKGLNSYESNGN